MFGLRFQKLLCRLPAMPQFRRSKMDIKGLHKGSCDGTQ